MKPKFIIIAILIFVGCATEILPIQKIEYTGPDLPTSKLYKIGVLSDNPRIFSIISPESEQVLLNLYEANGKLGITLYHGPGGSKVISFDSELNDHGYKLNKGSYSLILIGEKGKNVMYITQGF